MLKSEGDVAEIRCLGPGAWHPLDPSWVPLPVPGAGKIYSGHGVRSLAIQWCASTTDHWKSGGDSACACHYGADRGVFSTTDHGEKWR